MDSCCHNDSAFGFEALMVGNSDHFDSILCKSFTKYRPFDMLGIEAVEVFVQVRDCVRIVISKINFVIVKLKSVIPSQSINPSSSIFSVYFSILAVIFNLLSSTMPSLLIELLTLCTVKENFHSLLKQ